MDQIKNKKLGMVLIDDIDAYTMTYGAAIEGGSRTSSATGGVLDAP